MRTRRIWVTAATVATGIIGVLTLQGVTGLDAFDARDDDKAPGTVSGPVVSKVRTEGLDVAGNEAVFKDEDTKTFSMLAVSWDDPARRVDGTIRVRTHSTRSDSWSDWLDLGSEGESFNDGAARRGLRGVSEPAWAGPSDGVEVRVTGKGAALPAGLRVDLVDPGRARVLRTGPAAFAVDTTGGSAATEDPAQTPEASPSQSAAESATPSPEASAGATPDASATPTPEATPAVTPDASASASAVPSPSTSATPLPDAPLSTVPKPPFVSRAQWGADETMNDEAPTYGKEVKAVFVHHTAQTNTYTCADSAAIVRGIHTLHVKTNGWKDVGYNFLVDKCGTVFEGRKGGLDLPVIGAHTMGWNTDTAGIAVIGSHTEVDAAAVAKTAVARVAAWKLGQYRYDPQSTVQMTAAINNGKFTAGQTATFQRISGHRDGYATECPGTLLYGQLPLIRTWAAGPVAGLAVKSVAGAALSGSTYWTKGQITVGWSSTTPASLITRHELLVDGKSVATASGTATSAATTLALGSHQVQVRATHQSGRTATSAAVTVVAETTAPTFTTKPSLALRTGTVNTTAVPVTLGWKAADTGALKDVRLTAPLTGTFAATTTGSPQTAKSGVATTWTLTASDFAGNTAAASVAGTPVILQETAATRTGTWSSRSSTSYLGGTSLSSATTNSSLTWTFTGRSVAWVVSRASTSGQAHVYVDGVKAATVDLKSATTKYRDAIFTKSWATSGTHKLKIVVVGTAGRPTLTTDGIAYLK
ncbi:N-acetylmuramoyl-L-alanine amidase [Streptomyces bambusae]|uniref:N-acetylmuramoyl-L-alanine amidase n=1 Tax=Streptomyces bambusae TaxID=1550616 RepID=UPI001CFEA42A|nr:N-acetylmuramoyl-L-alanine amidase [Streptomyces bambusae]MCB5164875.1 N-acetylmuramoyl-L-alanine amidase [Streptomyces bambusae]